MFEYVFKLYELVGADGDSCSWLNTRGSKEANYVQGRNGEVGMARGGGEEKTWKGGCRRGPAYG